MNGFLWFLLGIFVGLDMSGYDFSAIANTHNEPAAFWAKAIPISIVFLVGLVALHRANQED